MANRLQCFFVLFILSLRVCAHQISSLTLDSKLISEIYVWSAKTKRLSASLKEQAKAKCELPELVYFTILERSFVVERFVNRNRRFF
jgi:hypothetical protein